MKTKTNTGTKWASSAPRLARSVLTLDHEDTNMKTKTNTKSGGALINIWGD